MLGIPYTGGTDTITLGGGAGQENGVTTTDALATMLQNRRRDGRTITLANVIGAEPGYQLAAVNGPDLFPQAAAVVGASIAGVTLQSAVVGGSNVSTWPSRWDRPAAILVSYSLS